MLRSHRRFVAALAGLAAILTSLWTGAFFGALYAPHYGEQTARTGYSAAAEQKQPQSQIDGNRAGLPDFAERITSGPDPKDGNEVEKRDLAAQESMSVWAFWGLVIAAGGLVITSVGTGFLLWQIILTRRAVEDTGEATQAMREANEIMRAAEDARLIFNFPDGAQDSHGDYLLDMVITNIGRSACTIHSMKICDEEIIMETVILVGEQKRIPRFAIVPSSFNNDLIMAVDRTYPLSGRIIETMNFRVLRPMGTRKTWWALQMDNIAPRDIGAAYYSTENDDSRRHG